MMRFQRTIFILAALGFGAPLALAAPGPTETYRCLESAKSRFSVGVALTDAGRTSAESNGAVTLIQPENEDSEANFTVSSIRREKDRIELKLTPIGSTAEATGLRSLKIRPSGRAESTAEIQNGAVTLSCTRQFLETP